MSHSVWGAWIEMLDKWQGKATKSRTPYGVRGLKSLQINFGYRSAQSHSVWGAWIEMTKYAINNPPYISSHSVWGAWIEI